MERRPAFFCHCEEGQRADGGPLRTAAPTKRRRWGCRGGYYPPGDCQKSLSLRGGQSPTWQSVTIVPWPPCERGLSAKLTEGFRPPVVPLIRHGLTPMPPSPLRGEGYSRSSGSAQISIAFPSSVTAAPCHLPPGEGIVRANLAFPLPGEGFLFLAPGTG